MLGQVCAENSYIKYYIKIFMWFQGVGVGVGPSMATVHPSQTPSSVVSRALRKPGIILTMTAVIREKEETTA